MIILGISGFENSNRSDIRSHSFFGNKEIEDLLCFSDDRIPIQFYPLHLIGHDCSAALIVNGKLAACASEERFSRVKHGFNIVGQTVLPRKAMDYCIREANISWNQIDYVAHYCCFSESAINRRLKNVADKLNSSRRSILRHEYETTYKNRLSKDIILYQLEKIFENPVSENNFIQVRHHLAHAAGAFYSSGFEESLILTIDGYGEEESLLWAIGKKNKISPKGSIKLPTSLGLLYQIITAYLGFRSFGDEYKVMGLSSYGDPKPYRSFFNEMVDLLPDGTHSIKKLARPDLIFYLKDCFGEIPSKGKYSQKAADIAASLQKTLEITVLHLLTNLKEKYPLKNLCISGGVGLNACLNSVIFHSGLFDKFFVQPASSDDGSSLGAALYTLYHVFDYKRRRSIYHVFWGPSTSQKEVKTACIQNRKYITYKKVRNIEKVTAELLAKGKIIGWFQGRMEMGPRALGARSILADPCSTKIRDRINEKIKRREFFRPLAPSVVKKEASKFFDIPDSVSSPFMLITFFAHFQQRKIIPGVVHVDGSSRLQTVSKKDNPHYFKLIDCFYKKTGIPLLLNTSFNRAGEPIVNTPEDAINCFLRSGLDALIVENYLIFPRDKRSWIPDNLTSR